MRHMLGCVIAGSSSGRSGARRYPFAIGLEHMATQWLTLQDGLQRAVGMGPDTRGVFYRCLELGCWISLVRKARNAQSARPHP